MTKTVKAHHAGQRPTTIWMPDALAAELDRKLADAAQPGLRPSRSGFILHAIQSALGAAAAAPPALGPTAALPAPTVQPIAPAQPVAPAQHVQAAQTEVQPRPESEPPLPELLAAFRALFRARKVFSGTDAQGEPRYRDLTEVELARADRAAATFYENLMDFARAGAAGLNEAPFHPADGWTEDENGEDVEGVYSERELKPLFSVFSELPHVFGYQAGDYEYRLPGPLAAAQAAHEQTKAKAKAKAEDEARRAAKRAAKAAAKAALVPRPDSEPVQAAVVSQREQAAAERLADREQEREAVLRLGQRRGQRAAEPEAEPAEDSPDHDLGPPLFSGAPAPASPFGAGPSES